MANNANSDQQTVQNFFLKMVIRSYDDLIRSLENDLIVPHSDLRALGNAAERCLDLADHLMKDPALRSKFSVASAKALVGQKTVDSEIFALTRDIANSIKHKNISRTARLINGIDDIAEKWALIKFSDAEGNYFAAKKVITVRWGEEGLLFGEEIIKVCIEEWAGELVKLSLLPAVPSLIDRKRKFERRELPSGPTLRISATKGETFDLQTVMLRCDAESGRWIASSGEVGNVKISFSTTVEASPFDAKRDNADSLP